MRSTQKYILSVLWSCGDTIGHVLCLACIRLLPYKRVTGTAKQHNMSLYPSVLRARKCFKSKRHPAYTRFDFIFNFPVGMLWYNFSMHNNSVNYNLIKEPRSRCGESRQEVFLYRRRKNWQSKKDEFSDWRLEKHLTQRAKTEPSSVCPAVRSL